jgi:hypothetical protein
VTLHEEKKGRADGPFLKEEEERNRREAHVRLPSQINGKAKWPFQSRGARPLLLEERKKEKEKKEKSHLTREKKETKGEDFLLRFFIQKS